MTRLRHDLLKFVHQPTDRNSVTYLQKVINFTPSHWLVMIFFILLHYMRQQRVTDINVISYVRHQCADVRMVSYTRQQGVTESGI